MQKHLHGVTEKRAFLAIVIVVYMLFFAESTLPGMHQRDVTLRAF